MPAAVHAAIHSAKSGGASTSGRHAKRHQLPNMGPSLVPPRPAFCIAGKAAELTLSVFSGTENVWNDVRSTFLFAIGFIITSYVFFLDPF